MKNRILCYIKSLKALWEYAFGDVNKAIIEFENCLILDSKNGPNLKTLGTIFVKCGRYSDGIERLQQALEYLPLKDSSVPEIYAYLAFSYAKVGKLNEAISYYKKAIKKWKRDGEFKRTDLLYSLGRLYLQNRSYGEAIDVFIEGLKLNSDRAELHFGLGVAKFEIGQKELSLSHIEKAVELDAELENDETLKRIKEELKSNITIH